MANGGDLKRAIGLMSGTSLDGIDLAMLETDGDQVVRRGASSFTPYDAKFRKRLEAALETAKAIEHRSDRPGRASGGRVSKSNRYRCHRLSGPDRAAPAAQGADGSAG